MMFHAVTGKFRAIPPAGWVALLALVGVTYLMWHQFANDDQDTDWTSPKEAQPPPAVAMKLSTPGMHGPGSPMSCTGAFRGRCFPGTLADSHTSIIGTF